MSIRGRLDRIERKSEFLVDYQTPLASILGQVDSLFFPHRVIGFAKSSIAIEQARREYHQRGLQWAGTSPGQSSRAWKSDERLRSALATAGLVKLFKSSGNLPGMKITDKAMDSIRHALGLVRTSSVVCHFLHSRLVEGAKLDDEYSRPGGWRGESWLFGRTYDERPNGSDWFSNSELFMPLLVAGCVESRSTTSGQVFYRVTDTPYPETESGEVIQVDTSIHETYDNAFANGLETRGHIQAVDSYEVFIPLSATG